MIIQATPYGTKKEEPFAFTYSGDFTDERVDGIGDVTLNTSGVFEVLSGKATVSVYILGAGGGASLWASNVTAGGGSGGNQTVEVELVPGTYEITIGTGGLGAWASGYTYKAGAAGGSTSAFGYTSTGGKGGYSGGSSNGNTAMTAGQGGSPNGNAGKTGTNASGGSPNGGSAVSNSPEAMAGGNGIVRITFS